MLTYQLLDDSVLMQGVTFIVLLSFTPTPLGFHVFHVTNLNND